jgi:DNA polymerase V
VVLPLPQATADTATLARTALQGLRGIYREGVDFAKAGVMLLDLQDAGVTQLSLELNEPKTARQNRVGAVMDQLNQRFGRGTLSLASAGGGVVGGTAHLHTARSSAQAEPYTSDASQTPAARRPWAMKQERRTPRYTSRIDELLQARA